MPVGYDTMWILGLPGGRRNSTGGSSQGGSSGNICCTKHQEGREVFSWDSQGTTGSLYTNYASTAAPLTDLTKKNSPTQVHWTAVCSLAFGKLKTALSIAPVLQAPDMQKQFVLQTDASDHGVGAVLSQRDEHDAEHPVAYNSRKLLPREERYSTIEKECLAIKLGIHAFRVYLLGKPFTIETDHRALEWLDRVKDNNPRLTRWSLYLQPYQFRMVYRPGDTNGYADGLSRGIGTTTSCTKPQFAAGEGGRGVEI